VSTGARRRDAAPGAAAGPPEGPIASTGVPDAGERSVAPPGEPLDYAALYAERRVGAA
jgi:hypothetical protein